MQTNTDKWTPGAAQVAPPIADIWKLQPVGATCMDKCVWVFYISMKIRECIDCGTRQNLWADFGLLGKPIKPD